MPKDIEETEDNEDEDEADDEDEDDDDEESDDEEEAGDSSKKDQTTADDIASEVAEACMDAMNGCSSASPDGNKIYLHLEDDTRWLITVKKRGR